MTRPAMRMNERDRMPNTRRDHLRGGYLGQAWLVLLLAAGFGLLLAGVQIAWGPIIAQNRENDARGQIGVVVPGADAALTGKARDLKIVDPASGAERTYRVYPAMAKNSAGQPEQIGWAIKATGSGYADNITLVLGVDTQVGRVTGMSVIANNETPGLGNKIAGEDFEGRFQGLSAAEPVEVLKTRPGPDENAIQAISGATISSQSVADIVNTAVSDLREPLAKLARGEQLTPTSAEAMTAEQRRAVLAVGGNLGQAYVVCEPVTWEVPIEGEEVNHRYQAWQVADADGQPVGWAVQAVGGGYKSDLTVLAGVSPDGQTMRGVILVDHDDTPGRIKRIGPGFYAQFAGKSTTRPLAEQGVDAVSGATISAKGILRTAERALRAFNEHRATLTE